MDEYNYNQQDSENKGVYFHPAVDVDVKPSKKRKSSSKSILITIIICITVIIVTAIICTFAWLGGYIKLPFNIHLPFTISSDADDSYISGGAELDVDGISAVDVAWIDGKINIEYYDGDKIVFSEENSRSNEQMCYKLEGGTLSISEYKSDVSKSLVSKASKNLTIKLPNGFVANEFSLEIVSATVSADSLNSRKLDLETVSGSASISFATQPQQIEFESVSGNLDVQLPNDVSGYTVSKETVSGSFKASDFGNELSYGDKAIGIEFESVSGNLTLSKDK